MNSGPSHTAPPPPFSGFLKALWGVAPCRKEKKKTLSTKRTGTFQGSESCDGQWMSPDRHREQHLDRNRWFEAATLVACQEWFKPVVPARETKTEGVL